MSVPREFVGFKFLTNPDLVSLDMVSPFLHAEGEDNDGETGYEDQRIESDEFNDLLMVEKAVKELRQEGLLSDYEMTLIEMLSDGSYKKDVSRRLHKNRRVIIKDFDAVCERIAYYLGGHFTDEGYVSYIKRRHKLTKEQVDRLVLFMNSKHRHRNIKNLAVTKEKTTNELDKKSSDL